MRGLRQTLHRSPVWREKDDLLRTVPGVGELLSLALLANLPELGTLNHREIAALEVWPESHWPGFALRQADVLQPYLA